MADIRLQVLWDGYFHALMYVLAAGALFGLWKTRGRNGVLQSGSVTGALLVGFGAWHVIDGVLSHWVLGIHRIKIDSAQPLLWDLVWLVAFGIVPLVLGWVTLKGGGLKLTRSTASMLILTVLTVGTAAWAANPPSTPFTTIVFRPDFGPAQVMATLAATDARLVWADPKMAVIVVTVSPGDRASFYAQGALLVSGSSLPPGCFDWISTPRST